MDNINPDMNVISFRSRKSKCVSQGLNIDFQRIEETGYQVIRAFGTDANRLERELNAISGGKLYYSARLNGVKHHSRVLPHSQNLSEQASCGGYHTDFMFQPHPPEFIALLCIQPDPRHPIYGRNQIVYYEDFLLKMFNVYGVNEAELLEMKIGYVFPNQPSLEMPIIQPYGNRNIFRLHTSLMDTSSSQKLLIGTPLKDAINTVCGNVANDIVLDRGDLLIVSNHIALHRRSECTLAFDKNGISFKSREMLTIRFDV